MCRYWSSILILIVLVVACSSKQKHKTLQKQWETPKTLYDFRDTNGEFKMKREISLKENNLLVVKTRLFAKDEKATLLEETTSVSEFGNLKHDGKKHPVTRPKIAQHSVWLEGQQTVSQLKVNVADRRLDVLIKTGGEKGSEKKTFPFPTGDNVFCFFSQIVECAKATGYFLAAVKSNTQLRFQVILDSYPTMKEQYQNIPDGVFVASTLSYDGRTTEQLHSFTLELAGRPITYHLDDDFRLVKMFWVAEGLSLVVE